MKATDVARIAREAVERVCDEHEIQFIAIAMEANNPEHGGALISMGCADIRTVEFILSEALHRVRASILLAEAGRG